MKKYFFLIIFTLLAMSCKTDHQDTKTISPAEPEIIFDERTYFDSIMESKNIIFSQMGPCEDALSDTIFKRDVAYIESEFISDTGITVNFKFKSTCCREYAGDYSISNDTLIFQYEISNNDECPCMCWYKYNLSIGELPKKVSAVVIKKKK